MRSSVMPALVLLAVAGGCRTADEPRPSPPAAQGSGTLALEGLTAPVTVIRDRWGVPHIRAQNRDDLFFAQGYVQAQDRLFQMDLWRRSSLGRLAEVLGPNFIERDAATQRVQFRGNVEEEWAHYGPEVRRIAAAFVRGINVGVIEARANVPEAFLLAGWLPELWQPEDLLNRTDAFVSSGNVHEELLRAQLIAAVGVATADALWPPRNGVRTIVPPDLDLSLVSSRAGDIARRVGTPPFFVAFGGPTITTGTRQTPGSNAWAAGGSRTESGSPLLATDPHRPLLHPALRYLVHLRAPGWHVAGATAPWLPGVVIGHNERIAWSFTTRDADTQDLFVERTNRDHPLQVRDGPRWVEMITRRVAIGSKGRAEPFEFDEQYTPRGVVVAVDAERQLAYTMRWSGREPGAASELAALAINQAASWDEFREAASRWRMPSVEFVYADVEGHVGRVIASLEPVRPGRTGDLPTPGWTGRLPWQGWGTATTATLDPSESVIVSANGDLGRIGRIESMLGATPRHTVESFVRVQQDVRSPDADRLVPLLAGIVGRVPEVESARRQLLAWDRQVEPDADTAILFVRWRERLFARLVDGRIPPHLRREFLARARHTFVPALLAPTRAWFEGDVESIRDRLLRDALADAVSLAPSPADGPALLNEVLFAYPLALTAATRERFNAGPFHPGGAVDAIQSIGGSNPAEMFGASFRLVLDLSDWDRARATQAPGQSERPDSPHFRDLAELWGRGEYFPLVFSDSAVEEAAAGTLTLVPF